MVKKAEFIYTFLLMWLLVPQVFAMPDLNKAFKEITFESSSSKNLKLDAYKGKVMLVFFGYTHCPDICPTTMLDLSKTLKELGEDASRVQPIFISVDFKRDSPERLQNYVEFFDKSIIGLTSSEEMLNLASEYFRTSYALLDSKDKENYIVEHSSNLYIIDENLFVKRIIPNGLPHTEITKAVRKILAN